MTLKDWAIYYAAHYSWHIFPIVPRGKLPAFPAAHKESDAACRGECGRVGHGLYDATNNIDIIASWWDARPDANIGLNCGRSGLAVIDLDGTDGIEAWNAIADTLPYRAAMVQYTGGGGAHLIYRQPIQAAVFNTVGKIAKHVDTRGVGGYILLAPSVHPNGNVYAWSEQQSDFDKMECFPEELLPRLTNAASAQETAKPMPMQDAAKPIPRNTARILQKAYERVAMATEGNRNNTLYKAAFYLFCLMRQTQTQLSENDIRDVLFNASLRAGLTEREITATLQSAYNGALRKQDV